MGRYLMRLARGDFAAGDPIVRQYLTIDANHFAIEQRISVYLCGDSKDWTVFIWVDSSRDLSMASDQSQDTPWCELSANSTSTELWTQPIVKYKPMLALKSHRMPNDGRTQASSQGLNRVKQSTCTLHLDYGRSLRPEKMACDPLYALKEVFDHVAQAEVQFLGLCHAKLNEFQDTRYFQDSDCLPNLKGLKQLLYRHLQHNNSACAALEKMCHSQWLGASNDSSRERTKSAATALKEDHALILRTNEHLHSQCMEAIGVLMNEIVIAESKEARIQTARLGRLTFLAFIFVPLSFTTSFFGMNVRELGASPNTLSIWAWFLLSMPLLAFAIFFFEHDFAQVWKALKALWAGALDLTARIWPRRRPI
ncbi:MAG: hypothetical protein Q9207_001840 [Kuettlingeria erythrocarpa]